MLSTMVPHGDNGNRKVNQTNQFTIEHNTFKTFSNPLFEKKDDFPSRNDESILKEEVHKETLKSYLNSLFEDDEEIISIESLPKNDFDNDDNLFEMDSKNDEWKRILYGEDFERMDSDSDKTKDFDKSSSSVFKSLSDEFEPGGSSYVEGNDLVCYEDFHVSDALFSKINEDKVFNPGILVDKNSKVEPKNDILNPKVLVFDPGIFDNVLTRKSSLTLKIFNLPSIVPPFIRTNSLVWGGFHLLEFLHPHYYPP
ncbi:hypothetical protein Tco_0766146 [Tanacetum coccineum]